MKYRPTGYTQFESFHPTFLYEAIWCTAIAILIIKFGIKLKAGQSFALYVASYCLGRFFIELIRIDTANTIAGLRVNVWVSLLVGAGATLYFARASKKFQ
jgi:prolipoprotein diacylglyceryltransferase